MKTIDGVELQIGMRVKSRGTPDWGCGVIVEMIEPKFAHTGMVIVELDTTLRHVDPATNNLTPIECLVVSPDNMLIENTTIVHDDIPQDTDQDKKGVRAVRLVKASGEVWWRKGNFRTCEWKHVICNGDVNKLCTEDCSCFAKRDKALYCDDNIIGRLV